MKNKKVVGFLLMFLLLAAVVIAKGSGRRNSAIVQEEEVVFADTETETAEAPERGPMNLVIIGPEEEEFLQSQARMYKARLENNYDYIDKFANCNWKYYLNEYDEEVFYREQENRSLLKENTQEVCGFTSTFIDKRGKLRVVLTVDIVATNSDVLQTLVAERDYTVR